MNKPEVIVFDRYTERSLTGGTIVFDRISSGHFHCRFNIMAARMMGLSDKLHVQFVKIGDEWFVCVTELNRGYKLSNYDSGFRAYCKLFVQKFLDDLRYSSKVVRFKLKATNHELAGQPLFQIFGSKVIKQ